jgi:cobalt-zinc-cadmium efflux system protein
MAGHHHHHGHQHDHHHGHDHGHHHGGHHHHHGPTHGRAFAITASLNIAFVLAEAVAGVLAHSTALLADAGHNLSDVLALLLAWGAGHLASRPPSGRYTYGLKSASILAALANTAMLWVALGAILIETLRHFTDPQPVNGPVVMGVAALGIAINGGSAMLLAAGSKGDVNRRAAFQHMLADAAVSAAVVVAGALVLYTGAGWIDPVTSLGITALIAYGSWSMLREVMDLALHAVPSGIDREAVSEFLAHQPGVSALHDLHIWPMSTTETALTAHITMPGGHPGDAFLHSLAQTLKSRFGIGHATVQVETEGANACALHPENVV